MHPKLHRRASCLEHSFYLSSINPSPELGRFLFVRPGRPKRTGSGQFKWKDPRRARPRVHFSRHNSPNSRALADRRTERL